MIKKHQLNKIRREIAAASWRSKRIYFRRVIPDDMLLLYDMYNSDFYKKYFIGSDVNIARHELDVILNNQLIAIIVHKITHKPIGINYIWKTDLEDKLLIFYYDIALFPSHIGKGFGVEACLLYLSLYFDLGFERVFIRAKDFNYMSILPAKKIGFANCRSPICTKRLESWKYFVITAERFYQLNFRRMMSMGILNGR